MNQARRDADAFDDLLGQLVDELAMTPTMPEPEPEPEHVAIPGGTTIGPMPMAPPDAGHMHGGYDATAAAPKSGSGLGIGLGIGGGIVILGAVVAGMILLRPSDNPPAQPAVAAAETKAEAKAPTPTPPPPAPGATPAAPAGPAPAPGAAVGTPAAPGTPA
ncbi:MAG: hypothetical protein K1X88_33345, partial [Nannocystaceae bacterium]|nr:hypothetical protein [Nannocystaceae bacterium]